LLNHPDGSGFIDFPGGLRQVAGIFCPFQRFYLPSNYSLGAKVIKNIGEDQKKRQILPVVLFFFLLLQ
jgi:hypothetical protein